MNNSAPPSATPDIPLEPMTFSTKLAYGAGDMGPAITANILAFFLLLFFTNVAGLNAGLAGWILMVGKVWDAVNDPLVGVLSDRTRSRLGRRLPWMLWGAIPFGLFFFLQWCVPQFSADRTTNQWSLFIYYVIISVLFNMAYTAVNLPYTALTAEITQDYNERTKLNSFRFAFSIGGSILSLFLAQGIFAIVPAPDGDLTRRYAILGGICTVLSVLPLYWCVFGIKKRVLQAERRRLDGGVSEELPFREQLGIAFSNRPFLYVIGIYFCSWLAVQVTATIIPYFVINWMRAESHFITVLLTVQITALLMLFVWQRVSQSQGKKAVYFMGMGLWIMAQAGLFFLQPGQLVLMYILAVMAGFGVSTAYLVPWSMVPDVIELDELQTGQRREGVFYAFMVLLQKIGLAVSLLLLGQGLAFAGFQERLPGQPAPLQPDSALTAIRIAIGPLPTVALLLGLVLAYFYPITRDVHANILLQLQERKRRSQAEEG